MWDTNTEDANVCVKCGSPLHGKTTEANYGQYWRHRRYEREYYHDRGGTGIGALVFGFIIMLVGLSLLLSEMYSFNFPWWPTIVILIGIWILFVGLRRSRRYTPPSL